MSNKSGFGLLEVIITISMVTLILSAVSATFSAISLNLRDKHTQQAHRLAEQEIEVLKSAGFANLTNQTNAAFRYVGYPVGTISIQSDPNAYGSKLLEISSTTNTSPFSALALLPGNRYDDFTFAAQTKVKANPPSGWATGLVLRYQDTNNYYWLYEDSTGIHFSKKINGATTSLYNQSVTNTVGMWYEIKATVTGNSFTLFFNGTSLTTVTDSSLTFGQLGVAATNNAAIQFDNLTVTGSGSASWDFEAETVNQLPTGWERTSLSDLPQGAGTLTIENYLSSATIKKITVTVTWVEKGTNQSVKLVSLISQ